MGHKIKIAFISIGDSISSKERLFPPMPTHHIKIRTYQGILFGRFFGERLWLKLMNRLAFPAA